VNCRRSAKVQDDDPRCLGVGVKEMIEKPDSHAIELRTGNHVFESAEGRLAGKVIAAFRKTVEGHLESGILPHGIAVVAVLIAAGDLVDPLGDQVRDRMHDRRCPTGIGNAIGKLRNDPGHGLDFLQQQDTGIAGGVATLEIKNHFFALDRRNGYFETIRK